MPLELKRQPAGWECPYCLSPVGYLGKGLAKMFGTRMHGCTFGNVVCDDDTETDLNFQMRKAAVELATLASYVQNDKVQKMATNIFELESKLAEVESE